MKLQEYNPILYLEDYENIPDEIYRWKQDEELHPGPGWGSREAVIPEWFMAEYVRAADPVRLCVGIGRYHTELDGDIYLCALIDETKRTVESCSFGVYRSAELVGKALDIYFSMHMLAEPAYLPKNISLLSSRNPIYQKKEYRKIISKYPIVPEMTAKGTRGGVAVVSTYFSQLMRRKGSTTFYTWQDAVDWLSSDIVRYNQKIG